MRILFVIGSLRVGGAEQQLIALATQLRRRGHDVHVAVFYSGGKLEQLLESTGMPLIDLRKRGHWRVATLTLRLAALVRRLDPDVVHSYCDVPNVVSAVASVLWGRRALVWGIRNSEMVESNYSFRARVVAQLERRLVARTDLVITNSEAGRRFTLGQGFPADKVRVVHNGIDTRRFTPRASGDFRRRLDIPESDVLVGLVGRLDPMKDHPTFLRAAARIAEERSDVSFVCVGDGPESRRDELASIARSLGVGERVRWAAAQKDPVEVYAALDVLVLASAYGEGFPNVVGEAMACGRPCVVTDVGDAALVVGDVGRVVDCGSDGALAVAVLELVDASPEARADLGRRARERVTTQFSVEALAENTLATLSSAIPAAAVGRAASAGT